MKKSFVQTRLVLSTNNKKHVKMNAETPIEKKQPIECCNGGFIFACLGNTIQLMSKAIRQERYKLYMVTSSVKIVMASIMRNINLNSVST